MNCINETKISIKEFSEMMRITNTHINPKITLIGSIITGIIIFILLILDVMELEGMRFSYVIIPSVFLGIFIFLHIFPKTFAKVSAKQNTNIVDGINYKYAFKDDCFEAESQLDGQSGTATINYSSLYDVVDKKYFVAIYISKTQVYLCKYDGFVSDDKDECLKKLLEYSKKSKKEIKNNRTTCH